MRRREIRGAEKRKKGCREEEKGCGEKKKVYFGATVLIVYTVQGADPGGGGGGGIPPL